MQQNTQYVILAETSGSEKETWLYYIKLNGNENMLYHLKNQLQKIDMMIIEELSHFELDLDHPVSEITAKEMSKVHLNHYMYHRKFDGLLKKIDLEFKSNDHNETMLDKLYDVLGMGGIEHFIDKEDVSDSEMELSDHENSKSPAKIKM